MKKVISLMLVMAMVFGVNVTSYAKEPEARKEAVVAEAELDTSVLKENVETASVARIANLAEFDGYVADGSIPVSFYVPSSKTTVYITIASTAACKVQLLTESGYTAGSAVSVPGDSSVHTYSLRKNCFTGTYKIVVYSESPTSFYTAFTVSYTQQ